VPQNGAWWAGLGLSLAAEGRAASAREAFERARATGTLAPELQLYVERRLRATAP
jgi:MSHA biogenesis protein MshN